MMNISLNLKCETRRKHNFATAGMVFIASALLAGCSSVPDWANPVEWYNSASEAIMGDEKPSEESSKTSKAPSTQPQPSKGFPNLGSVPPRPTYTKKAERINLEEKLKSDRANAKYAAEIKVQRRAADTAPPSLAPETQKSSVKNSASVGRSVPAMKPAPMAQSAPVSKSRLLAPKSAPVITSLREPNPQSGLPEFSRPLASTGINRSLDGSVRSLISRPIPSARSVSRVGNPTFGPPPADIARFLGVGMPPATIGGKTGAIARPIAAARSAMPVATGEPVAVFNFKAGSANLSDRELLKLRKLLQAYRQRGGGMRVEGHSSSRTRDMDLVQHHLVNFNLSLNRGNAVARELVDNGVPKEAVVVIALSDSRPLYAEIMPSGDAGNQRVEVYFIN